MSEQNNGIYHEKQIRELCALHALNNLLQEEKAFTKNELDQICQSLSPDCWVNPHCSPLGLGNYDVNVIMSALQRRGYEAIWFDKRKDPDTLQLDHISGFILNVPSEFRLGFVLLHRRHWVTVRRVHGQYYNLDSKLDSPQIIGKDQDLMKYLRQHLSSKEKELFIVTKAENTDKWLQQEGKLEIIPR